MFFFDLPVICVCGLWPKFLFIFLIFSDVFSSSLNFKSTYLKKVTNEFNNGIEEPMLTQKKNRKKKQEISPETVKSIHFPFSLDHFNPLKIYKEVIFICVSHSRGFCKLSVSCVALPKLRNPTPKEKRSNRCTSLREVK